jgi:CBS domain-containing protein
MITARDVMTPTSQCIGEGDSVARAATVMRELDVSSVPVCGRDGRLSGVLTERDIVIRCLARGWDPYTTATSELAHPEPLTVSADDTIEAALLKMAVHDVHRLPVVEKGSLVGMLDDADLAESLPDDELGQVLRDPRA